MALPDGTRRLVVNADDFGRSRAINTAIIQAHQEGILTTTSLMVNGEACAEAVSLARQNPRLGVGLHLALVCGQAALPPTEIPGLANAQGQFSNDPVATGLRYFFLPSLRAQLAREMETQFAKFHATGLPLDHVNGHLNLHLHPVVFNIMLETGARHGMQHVRLTRDRFWLNTRLAGGHWLYRVSHGLIFWLLAARSRPHLAARGLRHTNSVFGLLQNARVDEAYILRLLPWLPAGDSELYSHPSVDEFKPELDALISPRVKSLVQAQDIRLIRYQDL
jgi:hopanoid biosynthesis associated protein HpnK